MAEWLIEQGIGEDRALLVENERAIAARIAWHGELQRGQVEDAVLIAKPSGSRRGRARFANGEEALVDRLPGNATEGAPIRLEVTRPRIFERTRGKLAQARPTQADCRPAPSLAEDTGGRVVRRFPRDLWEEVLDEAWTGTHDFTGGSLQFSPTPAMTLVDIDGHLPPRERALKAVGPLARAIALFDLGGSIGIDFPTLQEKDARREVDRALDLALSDWAHERTAMNGFGFVQLVSRLERQSILHRLQHQPAEAGARLLLRRAEEIADAGAIELRCHPAVEKALRPEWLEELARRTGRTIRVAPDPTLAISAAFAQAVPL